MKSRILTICLVGVLALAGCGEGEFAGGFVTGLAAMEKMAEDAQDKFIVAVNELNAETAEINAKIEAVEAIEVKDFIKPETIAAIESAKSRTKDPVVWVALVSILANAFLGGKATERKKVNGS